MNRVAVDYNTVDNFVAEQSSRGNDLSWDGWTLVFFKPSRAGYGDRNGAFKDGRWGIQARIDVDNDGVWRIPTKYLVSRRKGT